MPTQRFPVCSVASVRKIVEPTIQTILCNILFTTYSTVHVTLALAFSILQQCTTMLTSFKCLRIFMMSGLYAEVVDVV